MQLTKEFRAMKEKKQLSLDYPLTAVNMWSLQTHCWLQVAFGLIYCTFPCTQHFLNIFHSLHNCFTFSTSPLIQLLVAIYKWHYIVSILRFNMMKYFKCFQNYFSFYFSIHITHKVRYSGYSTSTYCIYKRQKYLKVQQWNLKKKLVAWLSNLWIHLRLLLLGLVC